jgi:hypothetical protein
MKPPYILKVTYPIVIVMAKTHSPALAIRAPRSIVLAVCDTYFLQEVDKGWLVLALALWLESLLGKNPHS